MKMNKPPKSLHLPSVEKEILEFWEAKDIPARIMKPDSTKPTYTYIDGPPFATGLPHFGHFIPNSLKDAFARYYSMKGYYAVRPFGWDCHGVPVEMLIQKELGIKSTQEIEAYGIGPFNKACRESVQKHTHDWREYFKRLGRWVDYSKQYQTMDRSYMESVWAIFKELFDKGYIYEGKFVVNYSPELGTTLSNFEAGLDYRDVQDPSLTVSFKLTSPGFEGKNVLVWTTTPWTLPANVAVAVHPDMTYCEISYDSQFYFVLENKVEAYFKDSYTLVRTLKGEELAGLSYEPLFTEFTKNENKNSFKLYSASYVLADMGSGFVHAAPAFGEDDFSLSKKFDLEIVDHLNVNGRFLPGNQEWEGLFFKDSDKLIIQNLKKRNLIFKHETFVHSYPFCYRSGAPLFYRAVPSWFVKIEENRELFLKTNDSIHWVPEHIKHGRFGKWLANARDWNIARSRYWGNPIPIWRNEETEEIVCLGSIEELSRYTSEPISDLHMDAIEHITIPSKIKPGAVLKRVPFVLDCWFESGSAPYAPYHYPFENKESFEKSFPADLICEGLDQTRAWFYTLTILSTLLKGKSAFKNVIVNGLVLAEDGKKMSKSQKNFPDPMLTIDECGADSLRIFLLSSSATRGEEVCFNIAGVKECTRRYLLPIWNAYSFLATYASLDGFDPDNKTEESSQPLDRWISLLSVKLVQSLEHSMVSCEIAIFFEQLQSFLELLNNWYIRRNRRRFWSGDHSAHKTLHDVLIRVTKVLAPFAPFFSDYVYGLLTGVTHQESIHFSSVNKDDLAYVFTEEDNRLLKKMECLCNVIELGRQVRVTHKIKNRQPLSSMTIGILDPKLKAYIEDSQDMISDELNVKKLFITEEPFNLASILVKPNFKTLGKVLGPKMKEFQSFLESLSFDKRRAVLSGGSVEFDGKEILADDLVVELRPQVSSHLVATGPEFVVALDGNLTDELILEGQARDLVSLIQKARKNAGFEVEDRVSLHLQTHSPELTRAISENKSYIEEETLSQISLQPLTQTKYNETVEVNKTEVVIHLS